MNKIVSKIAEVNKFKLPIVFYDIVCQEQYEDYMERAHQNIKDLKQKQQLESLEIVMHFLYNEQHFFQQVADIVRQKSTLQQLIFDTHASGEIKEGIKHIMDSIATLNKLKIFQFRNYQGQGEDPQNQLIIKNTLVNLQELEHLGFCFQYGNFGNDAKNLQYLSEGIISLKKLQTLDLYFFNDNISQSPKGIDYLGQNLSELNELQEFKLQLYGNNFGNNKKSLQSLGQMIGQLPQTVQKIQLGLQNNHITYGINDENDLQIINHGILQLKNLENLDLKLNLEGNVNNSKLEKKEVEQILLGEVKDRVKNIEIIL